MKKRKLNFNAGPATLPAEVMQQASDAVLEYDNSGLSILEIPHRGKQFLDIIEESKILLRELCGLNDDYEILWMQGGGRLQFCMIPMNFLGETETAGYIDTDHWSDEAIKYAAYYGKVKVLTSSKNTLYDRLPQWPTHVPQDLSYLHLTTNNTIYGTQWDAIPSCDVPLIADMSSDIFSEERNYNNYAMFYAVAQKNLGIAGATLAVIRKDMLGNIKRELPPMLDYRAHVKENSVLNTSPIFAVYTSLLMLRWTKEKGIKYLQQQNEIKADLLYQELERNTLFEIYVKNKEHRSKMNVCFIAKDSKIESAFLALAEANDITGIKGHRSIGGLRVSLYNAIEVNDVERLVGLMREFENKTTTTNQ